MTRHVYTPPDDQAFRNTEWAVDTWLGFIRETVDAMPVAVVARSAEQARRLSAKWAELADDLDAVLAARGGGAS